MEDEVYLVNVPVKVITEWSDEIVDDIDEEGNVVSYRSGWLLKVLPNQVVVHYPQMETKHLYTLSKE